MRNFGAFVYLDLQKTGTHFIGDVLMRFSRTPQLAYRMHGPVGPDETRDKFHFISCRDPLDQYLSLYSFGCEGKGLLAKQLHRAGRAALYDGTSAGFHKWLKMVLNPANADLLGEGYQRSGIAALVGFQTFRLLMLSIAEPARWVPQCRTRNDISALYDNANLADYYVRVETLRDSLVGLLQGPLAPYISDVPTAVAYTRTAPALNTSARVDADRGFSVPPTAAAAIEEREWLFFEKLGYPRYSNRHAGADHDHTRHADAWYTRTPTPGSDETA